ncbi:MAG: 3-phosphoshikimate 1-carboxyvinyltransferase [bacterium]|nr:3-phosphoshikimate 1-carboxyvinyltransferase [bacterium]
MSSSAKSAETYAVRSGRPVHGRLVVPGSKSVTQRYFNLALLGRLQLVIHRPLLSEDTRFFLGALEACGFRVDRRGDRLRLTPLEPGSGGEIFCGAGGTMFRFLTAALTTIPGTWKLDGIERLRERTVGPLIEALRQLGAEIACLEHEGFAPLVITGGSLRGGHCALDAGASSQFLSALLMAALSAEKPTTIEIGALTSAPYVDLTLDAISELGGTVERDGKVFHVRPGRLEIDEVTVEADYSAVAYPAAAAMLSGGEVMIEGLRPDSRQGDRRFVDLLERMGGRIRWHRDALTIAAGDLRAVDEDLSTTPDQVPTLAALAPFAAGTTRITGVPHLRIKESDRLSAMAQELQRVGAQVEELEDGLVIPGVWAHSEPPTMPAEVRTHGDHRIAMSMALVGLRRPGITILDSGVVSKSYPAFWRDLDRLTGDEPVSPEAPGERALSHPALQPMEGVPLERARLTDQHRLAVVLQAAALLSHLEHGGWFLPDPWEGARLSEDGYLRLAPAQRGHSGEQVQVSLLRLLRGLFQTEDTIAGRGEARRAARYLMTRWQQVLTPSNPDQAVAEILESAPFLWQDPFAPARRALLAVHAVGEASHLWVAGPGAARRRFLARAEAPEQVSALLASQGARDLWDGWSRESNPEELAVEGRWSRAVAAWRRHPPRKRAGKLAFARCLYALGRYEQALETLKGLSQIEARLLRAHAQMALDELNAAAGTVRRLSAGDLTAEQTVELAEMAIRLAAKRGKVDEIRDWAARALAVSKGKLRLKAAIIAAGAAFDRDEREEMDRYLEQSRPALEDPELAGRWHHMRAVRSIHARDGLGVVEHVSAALRLDRRRLLRAQAGRLWSDLAIGRVYAGDLPGAEKALTHAYRLLQDCDGPSRTTLVLYNLAEVRLRRGRTAGVESILERSTGKNRRTGNVRGLLQDLELWVRLELVQGRAAAALARCTEAHQERDRGKVTERQSVIEVMAARAHGWLGRPQLAAACLERSGDEALRELEPEERPAVWALAGQAEEAAKEAAGTRWEKLWNALLARSHPAPETWEELRSLEPFRAARLTFDCELALPGVVPPRHVQHAIETLRRCGAADFADRLENRSLSPWRAVERYIDRPIVDAATAGDLLSDAGYREARLTLIRRGRDEVLVAGAGGSEELSARLGDARIVLHAPFCDRVLRALFALISRDLKPPREATPEGSHRSAGGHRIIGESPTLQKALQRLDQLAKGELPLLILGESGTGKELAAQRTHQVSSRAEGPFLPINCAELSESLIQSELFGHLKGSFTGADRNHSGIFESARSGTVFLDEIGDLPQDLQGRLLRVVQEGEIRRVGESFARKVDVRVITATHRDLAEMVERRTFRQDLFYRLNAATINLPPLRDREDDVILLADHFLARMRPPRRLADDARAHLLAHSWPGNVRELRNLLEVAAALAEDDQIGVDHLDLPYKATSSKGGYHQQMEQHRKALITKALSRSGGSQAAAARKLGLSRQALSYLVRQLDLG